MRRSPCRTNPSTASCPPTIPRTSRFVGTVLPDVLEVVEAIARSNGETVQVHGAEAAKRFRLSTQVPTAPVFHTSASSRTIRIGSITVRMVHTSNRRRLQFAGEATGAALSALAVETYFVLLISIQRGLTSSTFMAPRHKLIVVGQSRANDVYVGRR